MNLILYVLKFEAELRLHNLQLSFAQVLHIVQIMFVTDSLKFVNGELLLPNATTINGFTLSLQRTSNSITCFIIKKKRNSDIQKIKVPSERHLPGNFFYIWNTSFTFDELPVGNPRCGKRHSRRHRCTSDGQPTSTRPSQLPPSHGPHSDTTRTNSRLGPPGSMLATLWQQFPRPGTYGANCPMTPRMSPMRMAKENGNGEGGDADDGSGDLECEQDEVILDVAHEFVEGDRVF